MTVQIERVIHVGDGKAILALKAKRIRLCAVLSAGAFENEGKRESEYSNALRRPIGLCRKKSIQPETQPVEYYEHDCHNDSRSGAPSAGKENFEGDDEVVIRI